MSISVVMAVYNESEEIFFSSLNSIEQDDISEIIIVDDGSDSCCKKYLKKLVNYNKVILLENEGNMGLAYSLNRGVLLSKSKYIARMDSDDLCEKGRFKKQIRFLEENPDIDVVGSWAIPFPGNSKIIKTPLSSAECYSRLFFNSCMIHPSVMIRKSFFDEVGLYDEAFFKAQDYELWVRGLLAGKKYANLNLALLNYRIPDNKVVQKKSLEQTLYTQKLRSKLIKNYIPDLSDSELQLYLFICAPIAYKGEYQSIVPLAALTNNVLRADFDKFFYREFLKRILILILKYKRFELLKKFILIKVLVKAIK